MVSSVFCCPVRWLLRGAPRRGPCGASLRPRRAGGGAVSVPELAQLLEELALALAQLGRQVDIERRQDVAAAAAGLEPRQAVIPEAENAPRAGAGRDLDSHR